MELTASSSRNRVSSIDIARGLIMIIMALDHTREYLYREGMTGNPSDLATTTPLLFFTRWITHFCAPGFLFLSGISIYLTSFRKNRKEISLHLIRRGFALILLDFVVMTFIMTFNPAYNLFFLVVLWVFGWSMILIGLLIRISFRAVFITGLTIVLLHNLLDFVPAVKEGKVNVLTGLLLTSRGTLISLGANHAMLISYALLPWAGIMMMGVGAGRLYHTDFDPAKRRKWLVQMGFAITMLFLVLRYSNVYGDPAPWAVQKNKLFTLMSFLNTTKYPISLLFTCMTIGPLLMFLGWAENLRAKWINPVMMYGKTPLFYFMGHFLVIHILTTLAFFATGHGVAEISDPNSPFLFRPAAFGFSIGITYLFWIAVVLLMYFPCKWYAKYKSTHQYWWLQYI